MNRPRILLFRGTGWISRFIRWQTNGEYSHAAVELPDGRIIEAWHRGGVRVRDPLTDFSGVEAFDVPDLTDEQWTKAVGFMFTKIGDPYELAGG